MQAISLPEINWFAGLCAMRSVITATPGGAMIGERHYNIVGFRRSITCAIIVAARKYAILINTPIAACHRAPALQKCGANLAKMRSAYFAA